MGKKDVFTKLLAIVGTLLVWAPLLAMVFFAAVRYFSGGPFAIDYLIPAEILPVSLLGALLLLWAAFRARSRKGIIGWTLLAGMLLVVASQVIALASGMASGAIEAAGWPYYSALGGILGFDVAMIVIGNAGISLIRDVFKREPPASNPPPPETGQAGG